MSPTFPLSQICSLHTPWIKLKLNKYSVIHAFIINSSVGYWSSIQTTCLFSTYKNAWLVSASSFFGEPDNARALCKQPGFSCLFNPSSTQRQVLSLGREALSLARAAAHCVTAVWRNKEWDKDGHTLSECSCWPCAIGPVPATVCT